MKFTLSWLKDHLDVDAPLDVICATLTRIGLEVESVVDPAAQLKNFTIAHVLEAVPHPNADRLRVCQVDIGTGAPIQVVCGAPNARTGLKSVFSPPGTYIPAKNITISKGIIRGVESLGMLCSAAELELSEDAEGIIELDPQAPVGESYAKFARLDDPVIEINLTPNRPDAAGVAGIARDLAAAGLGRLKTSPSAPISGDFPCPVGLTLDLVKEDKALCPQFALRLVRGVHNGPSPDWMARRLQAIGLRPINALVDITNYVTFDRGRPLHVFDAAKTQGGLSVRRARAGEEILALNGKTYALSPDHVVIADAAGVESIAGVMGGEHSGCDANTTDVLIESALWSPYNIAHTGRKLGIASDARYRFERGVDPDFCVPGLELATRLVLDICGGAPSEILVAGQPVPARAPILFPWSEVERLTGLRLDISEMAAILEKLGFAVERMAGNSDRAIVHPPSWRPDIEGEADLVEEIIRIAGVDRVRSAPLPRAPGVAQPVLTLLQKRVSSARRALACAGLAEAVTYSFSSKKQADLFGGGAPDLRLSNPIAADLSDMRPSLLPGLLDAARRNADRGFGDLAIFEVGQIFRSSDENGQGWAAAGLRRGAARAQNFGRNWRGKAETVDLFDAKADAMALLSALGVGGAAQLAARGPAFLHPGRSGQFQFGPKNVIGYFGEIHPAVLEALDVEGPLCVFEIMLDALPAPKPKATKAKPKLDVSSLMEVTRDFAFIVDGGVKAADLLKAVAGADRGLIARVEIFDVYDGPGVPEGKKSLAVSVALQPREKTLTDQEIEVLATKIVAEAGKKLGAALRA